jgi:hypothetical protein
MPLPEFLTNITPLVLTHARETAGLTQAQAASLVYLGAPSRWGEYEAGMRNIEPARFELFLLLTDQHPRYRIARRRK